MAQRSPSSSEALPALAQRWRDEAAVLRRRGAIAQAEALDSAAAELESALVLTLGATVSLREAAGFSGYTPDALTRLVRKGALRNVGRAHAPRFRLTDLPRKPGTLRARIPRPNIASARQGTGSVTAKERS
jgi:hypothetical protein